MNFAKNLESRWYWLYCLEICIKSFKAATEAFSKDDFVLAQALLDGAGISLPSGLHSHFILYTVLHIFYIQCVIYILHTVCYIYFIYSVLYIFYIQCAIYILYSVLNIFHIQCVSQNASKHELEN